jgi:hypothetical protein
MARVKKDIQESFERFSSEYDFNSFTEIWRNQKNVFKDFWNNKILNKKIELSIFDTDAIIRLLDTKARGHQKTDVAVAHVGQPQGVWERLFKELKEKEDIKGTLNDIFVLSDEMHIDNVRLIDLINKLKKQNEKNKNGLTGEGSAVILNTLLFINNPDKFISCVSLKHRSQVMKAFDLGLFEQYKSYGEKIIKSNFDIINGFKEKYGIDTAPRALSVFLYSPSRTSSTPEYKNNIPGIRSLWLSEPEQPYESPTLEEAEGKESFDKLEFSIEKHLEDFLIRNWETTDLGKQFELIEEDGEIVSQQYRTDVGNIDLLVRDKKTKQYVVIELKRGQTSDRTVGQLARYMSWIKEKLASNNDVKGIIITSTKDENLDYALRMIPNTELLQYQVQFSLKKAK